MPLNDLNQEQKTAVTHTGGPLLIVAGAGTGKTTVITEKIAYLVEKKLAKTDEILALTFTDKAATEMEERVDRMMPYGYTDLWIMTFHSFCERILKNHGLDIGLPNDFKLLNQTEQWLMVRQNLEKFNLDYYRPLGNPTKFIHALIKHFSRCKDEEIWPEDYLKYAEELKINLDNMEAGKNSISKKQFPNKSQITNFNNQKNDDHQKENSIDVSEIERLEEISNAYHTYQQLLLDNESLDFGDLINYTLKLFRSRPHILKKYQGQFKYILVDEFQDTNFAQYELIKLLLNNDKNLTVVGDDDQSIYKFRGASVSNILQFKNDFPESKEIYLTKNYRSTQNILDLAYNFIQLNNPERLEIKLQKNVGTYCNTPLPNGITPTPNLSKKLIANSNEVGIIEHLHFASESEEIKGVINKIIELYNQQNKITCHPRGSEDLLVPRDSRRSLPRTLMQGGNDIKENISWNDFAILIRANNQAEPFLNALRLAEIPFNFVASKGLYQKEIILDIFAYLKLLDNYHESTAMWRILNLPMINIQHEDILEINRYANRRTYSLYEALKEINVLKNLEPETIRKINKILNLLAKHTALAKEKSVKTIVLHFLEDFGYNQYLVQKNDIFSFNLINQLGKKIDQFEQSSTDKSVKNFINLIELELEAGEEGSMSKEMEEGPEAVKIMTVHSAKGLEFKYVFIVNLVAKRFPSIERAEPIEIPDMLVKEIIPTGDIHLQEERRLFYVAMTRAKCGLFFTSAENYGGKSKKKLSRFLYEIGLTDDVIPKPMLYRPRNPAIKPRRSSVVPLPRDDKHSNQHFSYSSLKTFETCPYQYYLSYVAHVPVVGKATFSFGKTMHTTLQKFFSLIKEKENSRQGGLFIEKQNTHSASSGEVVQSGEQKTLPNRDILLDLYRKSWIDDWYESKTQKEEYKKQGEKSLKNLYEQLMEKGVPNVLYLEQRFNFKLDNYTIQGMIDRIDKTKPGLILLDYKTGSPKTERNLEKDQLLIYQMAAEKTFNQPVAELVFYYLDNNTAVSFLGKSEEISKIQEKILTLIKNISTSDFTATPEKNKCHYCDFKNICQYRII